MQWFEIKVLLLKDAENLYEIIADLNLLKLRSKLNRVRQRYTQGNMGKLELLREESDIFGITT